MAIKKLKLKGRIPIAIPSKGRSHIGTTWRLFPEAIVFVHENEKQDYLDAGIRRDHLVTHNVRNHCASVKNFILDYYDEGDQIIMLDDDIKKVGKFVYNAKGKTKNIQMDPDEFLAHLYNGFSLAWRDPGGVLFGVAPNTNSLNYQKDISVGTFINGALTCIVVSDVRFDEDIILKTDYDFTLTHIASKKKVFRLDYLWQENDCNDKMVGGTRHYNNAKNYENGYLSMMGKWPQYLRPNPKRENEFIMVVKKKRK